jgi:DNA excision repair protein ERCC-2
MRDIINQSKVLDKYVKEKKYRMFFEKKGNSPTDNDVLVENFRKSKRGVLFGINGGRNSEGLDFKDTQIKLIVIAGLPISFPTSLRRKYLDLYGFTNVYLIPALIKTIQSIGRAIRDEFQKALIFILDDRYYLEDNLASNLPKDLQSYKIVNEYGLIKAIKDNKEFLR